MTFSPLLLVAALCVGLALPLLVGSMVLGSPQDRKKVMGNLQRGLRPASERRTVRTGETSSKLTDVGERITTKSMVARLDTLLSRAGRPAEWPLDRVLAAKVVTSLSGVLVGILLFVINPSGLFMLIGAIAAVVGYFVPELLLYSRSQERAQAIELALADTLDQMTIAVEAGLGFDSAMARAGRSGVGPLAEEMVRTLQDIQLGHSRREAYLGLGERTTVTDLRRFVRAVVQADMYGVAIADVLRTQASEMRMKRRQKAEEKAMQIPVKVVFPLMLCILPVLFIVLLGPAVIDIVKVFSS